MIIIVVVIITIASYHHCFFLTVILWLFLLLPLNNNWWCSSYLFPLCGWGYRLGLVSDTSPRCRLKRSQELVFNGDALGFQETIQGHIHVIFDIFWFSYVWYGPYMIYRFPRFESPIQSSLFGFESLSPYTNRHFHAGRKEISKPIPNQEIACWALPLRRKAHGFYHQR